MAEQLTACLEMLCAALGVEALPVADVVMVEGWLRLPGFTPGRLQRLIEEQQQHGRRISSARYYHPIVAETFAPRIAAPAVVRSRPRLLSERPWTDYLAHYTQVYGAPDARHGEWLRSRWEREREVLGLPLGDDPDENGDYLPRLRTDRDLGLGPLPAAA